ncbi:hypothetical protein L2E82_45339 [Cichorium intybus]|uniref:Uncharacterized protein n=1 Tax=Cichorium intybus TaxID=13427 RepID=A0ACB8ZRQ9_CICIN|nr:hypothetical protein L2E82_45339 [Cichorium intybus]
MIFLHMTLLEDECGKKEGIVVCEETQPSSHVLLPFQNVRRFFSLYNPPPSFHCLSITRYMLEHSNDANGACPTVVTAVMCIHILNLLFIQIKKKRNKYLHLVYLFLIKPKWSFLENLPADLICNLTLLPDFMNQ